MAIPAWMMRKASMLWEAGRDGEAEELLNNSMALIKAIPVMKIASPVYLGVMVNLYFTRLGQQLTSLDRIRELVPMRCDVFGKGSPLPMTWERTSRKKTLRTSTSIEGEVRANVGPTTTLPQQRTGPSNYQRWLGYRHSPATQQYGLKYLGKQQRRSPTTTWSLLFA